MLVLRRKANQSIRIGDDIEITICEINEGHDALIGVKAPIHVKIVRTELMPKKSLQDKEATHHLATTEQRTGQPRLPVPKAP